MPADSVNINLLGHEEIDNTPVGRIIWWVTTYGRYIMIATEIVVLLAFISRFSLDRKLTDLNEEITQKQAILEANRPFEAEIRELQDRIAKAKNLISSQAVPLDILNSAQAILPIDVYLETYEYAGDKLTISAVAGTTPGFSQFLSNIAAVKQIRQVDIGDISRRALSGIKFSVVAHVAKAQTN